MDLFNKVHIFEPMKSHIYEQKINPISLISLMFNYAKPQILPLPKTICEIYVLSLMPVHFKYFDSFVFPEVDHVAMTFNGLKLQCPKILLT